MTEDMTRRQFMSMTARGAGFFSFAPLSSLQDLMLNKQNRGYYRPEWLRILAGGVDYYPDAEKQPLDKWKDDELTDVVHEALKDTFQANYAIFNKKEPANEKNLNHSVQLSKNALYVTKQYDGLYQFYENLPPVHFYEDPARGEILLHMSAYMIYFYISPKLDRTGSIDPSDMDVLKSIESHTELANSTLERAWKISPEGFRKSISNTNNLGYRLLDKTYGWMKEAKEQEINDLKQGIDKIK